MKEKFKQIELLCFQIKSEALDTSLVDKAYKSIIDHYLEMTICNLEKAKIMMYEGMHASGKAKQSSIERGDGHTQ